MRRCCSRSNRNHEGTKAQGERRLLIYIHGCACSCAVAALAAIGTTKAQRHKGTRRETSAHLYPRLRVLMRRCCSRSNRNHEDTKTQGKRRQLISIHVCACSCVVPALAAIGTTKAQRHKERDVSSSLSLAVRAHASFAALAAIGTTKAQRHKEREVSSSLSILARAHASFSAPRTSWIRSAVAPHRDI